jgi:molybdate transport system substrate-binding protein
MKCLFASLLLVVAAIAAAEPVQVAVAANFSSPLKQLVTQYRQHNPQADIQITVGSSGKLAAQIRQGAPYDIFLAADARRPQELASEGLILAGTVRTYAIGRLVLWSPGAGEVLDGQSLIAGMVTPVAMANPRTAPYGEAAQAVMERFPLPDSVVLVKAENVGQSYHFAHSAAAEAAFVALSQIRGQGGRQWRIPDAYYPPILQQAGLLTDSPSIHHFYDFLFSAEAQGMIRKLGYRTDEVADNVE